MAGNLTDKTRRQMATSTIVDLCIIGASLTAGCMVAYVVWWFERRRKERA